MKHYQIMILGTLISLLSLGIGYRFQEQEKLIKEYRNEAQEQNIRFEKVVQCFRDMSRKENDCVVKFDFEELEK